MRDESRLALQSQESLQAQLIKGKKIAEFDLQSEQSPQALAAMLGPTGNMRAPTLQIGKTLIVGFNEDVFTSQFG